MLRLKPPHPLPVLRLGVLLLIAIGAASCVQARGIDTSKPLTALVQAGIKSGAGKFSHATFDGLVKAHVKPTGRVDYAALKGDHDTLKKYLKELAAAKVESLSRNELLAFLINAYNAYTLDLIVRHYPVASIQKTKDPWDTPFCKLGGEKITLNDIEHKYLRPKELFNDPRMHFAINCASIGCPLLLAEAYVGDRIDAQLDSSVRRCLENPSYLVAEGDGVKTSEILKWFNGDFTEKYGTLSKFLIPYAKDDVKKILESRGDAAISYLYYDWDLNDVAK